MPYQKFKELRVWQEAKKLATDIYELTSHQKFSKDYGLKSQIQRAAVSIASNIAEGYEKTNKDFIRYLLIAKGSVAELRTQLEISFEVGYIDKDVYEKIEDQGEKINAMLINLIKVRNNNTRIITARESNSKLSDRSAVLPLNRKNNASD